MSSEGLPHRTGPVATVPETSHDHGQGTRTGYILVLDIGTTGARTAAFTASGEMAGLAYREYQSTFLGAGAIDHDPWSWAAAIEAAVPEVLERTSISPQQVEAVAVTTQRATILPVDRDGTPIAPAILWQDKRTAAQCRILAETIGEVEIYKVTGLRIDPYFSLPKLMWFHQQKPDVYRRAYCFLTVHDWIVHRLTGAFCTDWTQASRTQLFDVQRRSWSGALARAAGLPGVPLPEATQPGSVVGGLSPAAAERLGLCAGIPVVMAGGDQQCAAVGLGVIHPGQVKVTTGTGTFIVAPVNAPVFDRDRRVLCSLSAVPDQWVIEAGIFTSGAIYRWLRNEVAIAAANEARSSGRDPYERMNELAAAVAAGAGGVLLLPHFTGSAAPYWDPDARGLFFNLTISTSQGQLMRAALEGLALEASKNLAALTEATAASGLVGTGTLPGGRKTTDPIRVTGGLAKSDLFNQIQADMYGRAVVPGRAEQATALGAAVLAAVAIGWYPDVGAAAKTMCGVDEGRIRQPDTSVHKLYLRMKALHDKIYHVLHDSGVYREAMELTSQL